MHTQVLNQAYNSCFQKEHENVPRLAPFTEYFQRNSRQDLEPWTDSYSNGTSCDVNRLLKLSTAGLRE